MAVVFIYALCDPDTGDVRYIGKSTRINIRPREHLRDKGTTRKCRWIASLSKPPVLKVLETVLFEAWKEAEKRQIKLHRDAGCDLTNHTDGGDGRTTFLPEERKAQSDRMKKNMGDPEFRKKIFTEYRNNKISISHTGKKHSKEHVDKLPQNQVGYKQSTSAVEKKRISSTGRKQSAEWIAMISENNKGNQWGVGNKSRTGMTNSSEMNKKIGNHFRGRPKTAAQKEKMGLARKKWWAERKGEPGDEELHNSND